MALVGNIRDFGLSDFLYLVDRGYKTGCLHLSRGNESAVLFFDKGKLICAAHDHADNAGDMLVRLGKLTLQQLEHVRQFQNNSHSSLSQVLISNNIISKDDLQRAMQTYIEESVVYGLFGWTDGEFRFEHGQQPGFDAPVLPMPVPVEHLIMEGVRRIDEWSRVKDRIPDTNMIARSLDQPGEHTKRIKLEPEEWRVFARVNGKDTLATIAQKTNLGDFDVCRIVYGLMTAGLVEVVRKPAVARTAGRAGQPVRFKKSLVARIIERVRSM
jgi:hypothetical protein